MASDASEVLPDEFDRWVDEQAEARDVSRETVLARVLAASAGDGEFDGLNGVAIDFDPDAFDERLSALDGRITTVEQGGVDPERVADLAGRVEELAERLADVEASVGSEGQSDLAARVDGLDGRVTDIDAELDEKIADVRERVIQVKREADGKAPADHDHPEMRGAADRAAAAAEDLRDRLDVVETRVDEGFENFEEVLEYLTETTDTLEDRATTLAQATLDLRDRIGEVEAERSARAVADNIRAKANRNGDAAATCESCSRTVRLGLLSRPECPHCAATFADVDPSSGLFGSATLQTGRPPALDGETTTADSPDELFDVEGTEDSDADE